MKDTPGGGESSSHLDEATLAAFVDGTLSGAEAHEAALHLDQCSECRRLVVGAVHVLGEEQTSEPRSTAPSRRRVTVDTAKLQGRGVGRRVAVALAASVVLVLFARSMITRSDDTVRSASPRVPGEGLAVLGAYEPAHGDTVRASGLRFTWGAASAERYQLVLSAEDGTPIWTVSTRDTSIALADTVVLKAGALYFWQADAVGAGLTATTRLRRFTVAR
jgi:hypothetical protein